MNKMSKEKRDKLILTLLAVLGVLGILYTFGLGAQKDALSETQTKILSVQDKVSKAERLLRAGPSIEETLAESKAAINKREEEMAPPGQYFYWFLKLMDGFRQEEALRSITIVDITQPSFGPVALLPDFPYQAASFGVTMTGRFHELGKFLADFENRFPYMRVQDLVVQQNVLNPATGTETSQAGGEEKIMMQMKVVTLIKPTST